MRRATIVLIMAAGALWAALAVVHINDRYAINIVSGTWMALAERAAAGELYPPLFDGEHTGGTRYMPMIVVLHALVSDITGEFLISGKIVAYASGALMLAMLFVWLWQRTRDRVMAGALCAAVAVAPAGVLATLGLRGDALSIALQLAAMVIVAARILPNEKDDIRRLSHAVTIALAAFLCAIALLCKVTALWAPAAIAITLLALKRWRSAAIFLPAWLSFTCGGVAIFNAISDGRMLAQLAAFSGADGLRAGTLLVDAPQRFIQAAAQGGPAVWALAPLALLGVVLSIQQRRLAMAQIAMLLGVAGLLVLFADPGVAWNHIILLLVLLALGTGELVAAARDRHAQERDAFHAISLAAALVCIALGAVPTALDEVRRVLGWESSEILDPHVLRDVVEPGERILSDDPFAPLSLGQRPAVVDAYLLYRMDDADPLSLAAKTWVRNEIDRGGFAALVMTHEIDPSSPWFSGVFGPELSQAMLENYKLKKTHAGYFIYRAK